MAQEHDKQDTTGAETGLSSTSDLLGDRELLELAAKAAGMYVLTQPWPNCDGWFFCKKWDRPALHFRKHESAQYVATAWMPLDDDGDAFRLAVKLKLVVAVDSTAISAEDQRGLRSIVSSEDETDGYAATRRAIVRCAAAIGRTVT